MEAYLFLLLHIVISIVAYVLLRAGVLKCGRMITAFVFFIPVWGLVCLVFLEIRARGKQEANAQVGVEKLKINDEIYRSILMEEDPVRENVIPLGEALLLNDAATRRELMMEIMYADPADYVAQLQEASMNDDTEVVHYAVTALTELQKDYDLKFQEIEHRMLEEPDETAHLDSYLSWLERYLASGLATGSEKEERLYVYTDMLAEKLRRTGDDRNLYRKKVEAELLTRSYEAAYQDIRHMLSVWPGDEAGYLYWIQYCSANRDRAGLEAVLDLIARRKIHLSQAGRDMVRFWKEG